MRVRNVACRAVRLLPSSFIIRLPSSDIVFSILVALLHKKLRQLILPVDAKICRNTPDSASCITNTRIEFTSTQRTSWSPSYRTSVHTMFPMGTSAANPDTDPSDAHTDQSPNLSAVSGNDADHSRTDEQFATGQFSLLNRRTSVAEQEPCTEQIMNNGEEEVQASITSDDNDGYGDEDILQRYQDTKTGQFYLQMLIPIPDYGSVEITYSQIVVPKESHNRMKRSKGTRARTGKCIVVCCDGTWDNAVGTQYPVTNVGRLARCLRSETENKKPHVVYYSSGVGTTATPIGNVIQGAFGEG